MRLSGMLNELEVLRLLRRLWQRRLLRAELLLARRLIHPPVGQRMPFRRALSCRRSFCGKQGKCRDHRSHRRQPPQE